VVQPVRLTSLLLLGLTATSATAGAQEPTGLAAAALADTAVHWIPRHIPGFRAYFLEDTYPARHQDSLLARLSPAAAHARRLIDAQPLGAPIDVFFVETREQLARLTGHRATGFAEPAARAVFLVTNPEWRAFERHEIMHVIAGQAWGPAAPEAAWLQEGLAQAADGHCVGRPNAEVLLALTARHGWLPLDTLLTDFRHLPDLRAYLQAAAFVAYLLPRVGAPALRTLWTRPATAATVLGHESLGALAARWRAGLHGSWHPSAGQLAHLEATGCGSRPET
jgi:hypothetical protein